ncbi:MAG: hypothetical protein WCP73_09700, partial [Eubacteriales bacterium]
MKNEKDQNQKISKTKNMKRHLLIFALLPGFKSSWRQTTGGQAQVLQMEKPVAKFNIQKLLAMLLLALIIPLFSLVSFGQVSQTWTNTYTGSGPSGTWVVPSGVYSVTVTAVGGAGGSGGQDCGNGCGYNAGAPGGYVSQTYAVTPGYTLQIVVGGNGGNGGSNVKNGGNGSFGQGYRPGGWGGTTGSTGSSGVGGGGGGASAVYGGTGDVVAGGGGGGGGRCNPAGS